MFRRMLVVLMLSVLSACANMGGGGEDKMSMDYLKQHLVAGKTTKSDVQQLFGTPGYKSEKPDGADYWSYDEDQVNGKDMLAQVSQFVPSFGGTAGSMAVDSQKRKARRNLAIDFNSRGVVTAFHTYGSTGAGQ